MAQHSTPSDDAHTSDVIAREEKAFRSADLDLIEETKSFEVKSVVPKPIDPHDEEKRIPASIDGKCPFRFVPLKMSDSGRTYKPSEASRALIDVEVPLEMLQKMTDKFYELAFQDETLDRFIHSHDDPHGNRFARWIHSKLTGSTLWDDDRRSRKQDPHPVRLSDGSYRRIAVHDRTSAHVAAWHSTKRPLEEAGRHFNLAECRTWMRLHFWAMREVGMLEISPSFADFYTRFIGHFVAVYERTAPAFARESFRWSEDPKNIQKYIDNGRRMVDLTDVSYSDAIGSLPDEEALDQEWPYNDTP